LKLLEIILNFVQMMRESVELALMAVMVEGGVQRDCYMGIS
jgi:hypothetical protein